jgi:hypothetical protein
MILRIATETRHIRSNASGLDHYHRRLQCMSHPPEDILTLFSARPKSRRWARLAYAVSFTIATRQANFKAQIAPTDGDQKYRRDLPEREHSRLRGRLERNLTSSPEKSHVDFDEPSPFCACSTSASAVRSFLGLINTHRRS